MAFDLNAVSHVVTVEHHEDYVKARSGNSFKNIPYPAYLELISRFVGKEATSQVIVPPKDLLYISKTPTSAFVVTYTPEHIRELVLADRGGKVHGRYKAPLPNIIVEYQLTKGSLTWTISSANFYMTKESRQQALMWYSNGCKVSQGTNGNIPGALEGIRVLSLPNIYEAGNICLGGNHVSPNLEEDCYTSLDTYLSVLLEQPFSSDLSVPSVSGSNRNTSTWLEVLHGKESFPYELTSLGAK